MDNKPSINMEKKPSINRELLEFTTEIIASHVANNSVEIADLPTLIKTVYQTLSGLDQQTGLLVDKPKPAVSIKKSVTPEFIICLEDGKQLKMLKRHLKSQYGLTPDAYRERWGLAADYPMVAPNYANHRRILAKQIGLGKNRTK